MRKLLLTLFLLMTCQLVLAEPYGHYDPKQVLTLSDAKGVKSASINFGYYDQILNDLASHAKNYPTQFDTPEDKKRATGDVTMLSSLMGILSSSGFSENPEFLARSGFLNSMGHNLDISGSAQKAEDSFKKLLTIAPANPRGNYLYGTFLASTGKPRDALPFLQKAISGGVTEAAFVMGMSYAALGDKPKAIANLEIYKKKNPKDTNVTTLIEAIRNGKLEVKPHLG